MKIKKELDELREKTVDELEVAAKELRLMIEDERVKSYFGDQTSTNDVQSSRKKLARILTILAEKKQQSLKDSKLGDSKEEVTKK